MTRSISTSMRSDAARMTFTAGEFLRGAVAAWLSFVIISTAAFLPLLTFLVWIVLIFTVPWSIGALVVGSPFAYALGRALKRVSSAWVHLLLFTFVGAVIGVSTTALALAIHWSGVWESGINGLLLPSAIVCVAATVSVPLGWWHTARRALRRDRHRVATFPGAAGT